MIISDYIEGKPLVASVRFNDLMPYIKKSYKKIIIVNDYSLGSEKSVYSNLNYKFHTKRSSFTIAVDKDNKNKNKLIIAIEKLLRKSFVLKIWRRRKYKENYFIKDNINLLKKLEYELTNSNIDTILVTVPDIFGIYIAKYLKSKKSSLKIITEVRDILNNEIAKGNPKSIIIRAEKTMLEISDGIIVLSEGIKEYYEKLNNDIEIIEIKNGYNEKLFNTISKKKST